MIDSQQLAEPGHPARTAHFGLFELDLQTAELRRNGTKVRLQEQPFRLLVFLLERSGNIVTREELQQRLWPSEFVDFDHSLNAAVRKLREALGDSAENPRFIETLARRGYRFIAPVSWDTESTTTPRPRRFSAITFLIAAVMVIAVAAAVLLTRKPEVAQPARIDAIAVMPFTSEDSQSAHLVEGMTELLIDTLSRVPNMRVMARTTVFGYKGKKVDPDEIGRTLHVSGVIVGHLRHEGDRYFFHVELIDVRNGAQVWGNRFEGNNAELSTIQNRISQELWDRLSGSSWRMTNRTTKDSEAYQLYLRGLYAWNRRSKASLDQAEKLFKEAVVRDPNFAAGYAGLANTYGVMVGYGILPVPEGTTKVVSAAQKALELDPSNAEALVSLATTKFRSVWDFPGAEADYRRALALNPNYATGHQWFADYLRSMGRWDEARHEIETAYKLDPLSAPINTMMCCSFYLERRYREAIAFSQRASALDTTFGAPSCVGNSLLQLGDLDHAMQYFKEHESAPYAFKDVTAYTHSGREHFFLRAADWLKRAQSSNLETPVTIAGMYARAGKNDEAFSWLEKAYERRVSALINVNVDPAFDSLHNDPRYDDLLRRIGLPKVEPPRLQ